MLVWRFGATFFCLSQKHCQGLRRLSRNLPTSETSTGIFDSTTSYHTWHRPATRGCSKVCGKHGGGIDQENFVRVMSSSSVQTARCCQCTHLCCGRFRSDTSNHECAIEIRSVQIKHRDEARPSGTFRQRLDVSAARSWASGRAQTPCRSRKGSMMRKTGPDCKYPGIS